MKFSVQTLCEYGALVGLYTAGISHPIMQVVSEEAPFFVFHQAGWKVILTYWLLVVVIIPVLILSLLHVIKLISSRSYGFCYKASYLVLVILFVSFNLNSVYRELGLVTFVVAALFFTVLFLYLFRTKIGATVATALSLLLLINAWQFFLVSDISQFFNAGQKSQKEPLIQPSALHDKPPVFFLVFDELGTVSLLDKSLNIDRKNFPNFFALSEDSHWFRNASTVSIATNESIPALVTGNYSVPGYPPLMDSYPNNILRLFDQQANSLIFEAVTRLRIDNTITFNGRSLAWMLLDSSIIYAHMVLPSELRDQLPSIRQATGRFLDGSKVVQLLKTLANKFTFATNVDTSSHSTSSASGLDKRVISFREFIGKIRNENRFQFNFAHVLLPHVPWTNTASLKLYAPSQIFGHNMSTEYWLKNKDYVLQNYQRHLIQLAAVDKLLGEFLVHLKSINLYDNSIIIVTADHGVSFHESEHRRSAELVQNPAEIISVPLMIKLPDQHSARLSDKNVESIDIVPTIAGLLGFTLPWSTDGISVFDQNTIEKSEKKVLSFDWFSDKGSDNSSVDRWLVYNKSQLENIRRSVEYKNQYFLQDSSSFEFDTAWSRETRQRAQTLIDSGRYVSEGEIALNDDNLKLARDLPGKFAVSRIVAKVSGVSGNVAAVLKLNGNRRLETVPLIDNEFSFFFDAMKYDDFIGSAEFYILVDGKLLKPEVKGIVK